MQVGFSVYPIIVPFHFSGLFSGSEYVASKKLYEKTNRQIELISKIAHFIMVKLSVPGFVLPKAFVSFFKYFTTDLGRDAFELSLPVW